MIKQGAKLAATWEDVWEELSADVRLPLDQEQGIASEGESAASLLEDESLPPAEQNLLRVSRNDEALQMEEILEKLDEG